MYYGRKVAQATKDRKKWDTALLRFLCVDSHSLDVSCLCVWL